MQPFYSKNFKLGVLGGGQLGRMLIQEAVNLDVKVYCLDPSPAAPCSRIAHGFTSGDFNDYATVLEFGKDKDVVTIEIEHVNVHALYELEALGVNVYPEPRIIEMVQDKGAQKMFYRDNGIPTSPFILTENAAGFAAACGDETKVQKLRTGGYDGRGVRVISGKKNHGKILDMPSVMEDLVDIDKELSVIVSRNGRGEIAVFPAVEMEFNAEANLVEILFSPAGIDESTQLKAGQLAEKLIDTLQMTGLLAVEMFLDSTGQLLINEIAPRPHNSGHHTIEGNFTSQYAQHLRAILGLPPGDTGIIRPAAMVNLLGDPGFSGAVKYEGLEEVLKIPEIYVHLYGKAQTQPYRKMGHVTLLGASRAELHGKAKKIKEMLKVKA